MSRMFTSVKFLRLFLGIFFLPLTATMLPGLSWGQEYPNKPIQLIVGFPPGGLAPLLADLLAQEAKKYISVPVVPVYKPGAGGTIGAYFVAKSAPDGYTFYLGRPGPISVTPLIQKLEYAATDFDHLAQFGMSPLNFTVRADAPWKNLKEFVAYAKKNPRIVTVANSGTYSSIHLAAIKFEKLAGIEFTHVPFRGIGEQMTALAGGHVSAVTRFPGEGEALLEAGKVKVLTTLAFKRSKFYPDVPTSQEEGYPMEFLSWSALIGPKGLSKPIQTFWESLIRKLTLDRSFIEKAEKLKIDVEFKNAQDFKIYLDKEIQDFREVVKQLGLKPM